MPLARVRRGQQPREGAEELGFEEDTRATLMSLFSCLFLLGQVLGSLARAQTVLSGLFAKAQFRTPILFSSHFFPRLMFSSGKLSIILMIQAGGREASGIFFKLRRRLGFLLP